MLLIKNIRYFDGEQILENSAIVVSKTKILRVYRNVPVKDVSSFERVIDGKNRLLVPGYIDIHLHGCGGCDVMDGTETSLQRIAEILAIHGTTSFLPTTITMSKQSTQTAIETIRNCMGHSKGADILGIHMEGPFLNPMRKGAQNSNYIQEPSVEDFLKFVNHDLREIKRVTLAPEVGQGMELTKYLIRHGICVSSGHTCADFDSIETCADMGMKLCTHLFNGMDPIHHRDPGAVSAILLDDRIYAEFIPDLIHINKDILKLIVKTKGADKCILITDSLSAACLGDGIFDLGGQKVIVTGHTARIESGSLAGSIITMQDAVRNMICTVGIKETDVFKMAGRNPAKVIGADSYKGLIKEGYDADLNLLDDDYHVIFTMVQGRTIITKTAHAE